MYLLMMASSPQAAVYQAGKELKPLLQILLQKSHSQKKNVALLSKAQLTAGFNAGLLCYVTWLK
jgi:hypothetical protein